MGQCGLCGNSNSPDAISEVELRVPGRRLGVESVPSAATAAAIKRVSAERCGDLLAGLDGGFTYRSHRPLEPWRRPIFTTAFPELGGEEPLLAVVAAGTNEVQKEFTVLLRPGPGSDAVEPDLKLIQGTCKITFEDLSPADCIEYTFADAPGVWAMAVLAPDALETYRSMKFQSWKDMLLHPTCEAQFRRMLQLGVVTRMYDPHVFTTPDSLKTAFQVLDERTGKTIDLPCPVAQLRVWDPASLQYRALDTQLAGAPPEVDKSKWWDTFVDGLRKEHGDEYISSLMKQ